MSTRTPKTDDVMPHDLQDDLVRALKPVELPVELRNRMRRKIVQRARDTAPEGTTTVRADAVAWIEIAPFVEIRELRRDTHNGSHTSLLRMRPGGVVPAHQHSQEEEFIILEGACHIGVHHLCAGDTHIAAAGSWHGAVTTQSGVLVLIRGEFPYPAGEQATGS
jgi:quercetin dioxygenase-like cupin family protein